MSIINICNYFHATEKKMIYWYSSSFLIICIRIVRPLIVSIIQRQNGRILSRDITFVKIIFHVNVISVSKTLYCNILFQKVFYFYFIFVLHGN